MRERVVVLLLLPLVLFSHGMLPRIEKVAHPPQGMD